MQNNVNVSIYSGTSKKGKVFTALRVTIGEYQALLFPTNIEMLYIKNILQKNSHKDFQDGLDIKDED